MQDDTMNKEECIARFDDVKFWHSRTRKLIADAEWYTCAVFRESFWELRRESRRAEFAPDLASCVPKLASRKSLKNQPAHFIVSVTPASQSRPRNP
jgi:hypothetical protein